MIVQEGEMSRESVVEEIKRGKNGDGRKGEEEVMANRGKGETKEREGGGGGKM